MAPATKLSQYAQAAGPLPSTHETWPLYGPGLANLGRNGSAVVRPLPAYGPDELLVRNDAVGLCFSDIKIIQMGAAHPRLVGRDLGSSPLVAGHEVSLTVVGVGGNLAGQYRPGQRFAVQPDVWFGGRSMPYGYTLDGGFQQYGLIGPEILRGDAGSYLIPVPPGLTYVGAALTEPWACVEASYRTAYRPTLKPGGLAWFRGGPNGRAGYHLDSIWGQDHRPRRVVLTDIPADLAARLAALSQASGTELVEASLSDVLTAGRNFDDILVLDGETEAVDTAAGRLANGGILAIARPDPLDRPVQMDLGRLHYDHIVYVGTTGTNLDAAYRQTPVRTALQAGGTVWVLGAGGPMGRMHVQRALESSPSPHRILATEINPERAADLEATFAPAARARGIELLVLNEAGGQALTGLAGITDVEVMAAAPALVVESMAYLAPGGVINLFAGLKRGSLALIDAWRIYGPQQIRLVGHSGSALDDQVAVFERAVVGQLAPERSLAAIAGLRQVPQALRALIDATYPGKVVIFPQVLDFPLTALADLKHVLPAAAAHLAGGRTWTAAAETAFLEAVL